jgi:hypothetical protein
MNIVNLETANVVFEMPHCRIFYSDDEQFIALEIDGFLPHEHYVTSHTKLLELVEKLHCSKILYDLRKMKAVAPDTQLWIVEHFIPKIRRYTSKSATILSEDIFGKSAINHISIKYQQKEKTLPPIQRQHKEFSNLQAAIEWLHS